MRTTPENRLWMKGRSGKSANAWKGEQAGYHAIHIWLNRTFKKGDQCVGCGTKNFSRLEWANISGEYKRERSDYKALCPSCHKLFDIKDKCRKGHHYKPETTIVNIRGHRHCRICRDAKKEQYATA